MTTTTAHAPLASRTGGKSWKQVDHAAAAAPDVQLGAALYLSRAVRDGRLDLDAGRELVGILDLNRDAVITELIARAERSGR